MLKVPAKKGIRKFVNVLTLGGRVLVMLLMALGLVFLLHGAVYSHQGEIFFALQEISFKGNKHLSSDTLQNLIFKTSPKNLLRVNPGKLQELVESESWVKVATVRRQLPGRLHILIEERSPVAVAAIDEDLYVVDQEGIVLDRYGATYAFLDGPVLKGLKNVARENAGRDNFQRLKIYLRLIEALGSSNGGHSQYISEVLLADPERVAVVQESDPVPIYLGRERFLERYENFLAQKDIYRQLKKEYGRIEYIDVSYDNKIIFHTPGKTRETST